MEEKKYTVAEIIMQMIGPINPVGETHADNDRFENLKQLTELVDHLMTEIHCVALDNHDRVEFSMSRAGKHAADFCEAFGVSVGRGDDE
jgi:hypothetical protein